MLFSHLKQKFTSWYCADYCSQYAWKVVKLNICVSQGSATTELRRGGRFKSDFVRHFFLDATLKEFLKLLYICQSYHKNKSGTFFMAHSVHILKTFSPSLIPTILVFPCQTAWQYSNRNPRTRASNAKGVWKNYDFWPISRFISQMMEHRAIVTMEGE